MTTEPLYRAGTPIMSLKGEHDSDEYSQPRSTGPFALGYIADVFPDQENPYSVLFPLNGDVWVFMNDSELADEAEYWVNEAIPMNLMKDHFERKHA